MLKHIETMEIGLQMIQQHEQAMAEKRSRIKDKALRTIFVRFQKEGIHKYPAAALGE